MPKEPLSDALKALPVTSKIRGYRYLTCQGGGMKGGGFVGAVEMLETMGVMSQFEAVAGSSAGAIFAALVAVGYTAKEIRKEMLDLDFRRLQDKASPGWIESSGLGDLAKGFTPTEKGKEGVLEKLPVIKQLMQLPEQTASGLAAVEDAAELAFGKKLGLWKGEALLSLVQRLIARKTGKPNLTFNELSALAKIQPGVFRNLILTGSNLSTQRKEYYNAKDWPDMPIMDAVRISASFPGAYMPVTKPILQRKIGPDGKPVYSTGLRVDGGLLENLPDVFNNPPYFNAPDDKTGNPEVLALSFKEKGGASDEVESGFDLLRALYKTTMSESVLREKYKDNIVYIDTKGVGTLDFDAEKEKRDALSDSGWDSVQKVFLEIVEREKKATLSEMSLDELLRSRAYLLSQLPTDKKRLAEEERSAIEERLAAIEDHIKVNEQVRNGIISKPELQRKKDFELNKMERMLEVLKEGERKALGEGQLIDSCHRKIKELENIKADQNFQIKELNLIMAGFELRKIDFLDKFDKKNNKAWVEKLEGYLAKIKDLRERQRRIKLKLAGFVADKHVRKKMFEKGDISELEFNTAQIRLQTLEDERSNMLKDIKTEKDAFIKGFISHYRSEKDDFMCHFFAELNEEFDRPLALNVPDVPEKYRFPEKSEDIITFIDKQQAICKKHLKEAHEKKKKTGEEVKLYQARLVDIDKYSAVGAKYETLKVMEKELDRSIYEKTSFIAKINHYLVSDRPTLKNNIITGVMQFVAFAAFTARVAIAAAVAVPTLPWFIYKMVNLVKNYNSEGKAKAAADRYLRAFSMPNLFKLNKLKYLSKVTSDAVSVLDKNYDKADKTEHAHVYKLHQLYLKQTMSKGPFKPKFSDIFPRKSEDTTEKYNGMLKHFKEELSVEEAEYVRRSEALGGLGGIDPKDAEKFPVCKNFELFHEKVKQNLRQKSHSSSLQREDESKQKEESKQRGDSKAQREESKQREDKQSGDNKVHRELIYSRNVENLDLEFIRHIDKLIQDKKPSKEKSLSAILLEGKQEQEKLKQKHGASRFWQKSKTLTPTEVKAQTEAKALSEEQIVLKYIEAAKSANLQLPDYIREQFLEHLKTVKADEFTPEKLKAYSDVAEHYQFSLPESLAAKQQQFDLKHHMEVKNDKETEAALRTFYQLRSKEKKRTHDKSNDKPSTPKRPRPGFPKDSP